MLLIAGGPSDPDINYISKLAIERAIPAYRLTPRADHLPVISWTTGRPGLMVDGTLLEPTAIYIRWDAFSWMDDMTDQVHARVSAWFDAIKGWAMGRPDVRMINRRFGLWQTNKLHSLQLAAACGLAIPETVVTNAPEDYDARDWVLKPLAGGDYVRERSDFEGVGGVVPVKLQRRLAYPEMRIYRVGEKYFAFRIESAGLDYRIEDDAVITPVAPPDALLPGMQRLTDAYGFDYAAADFKTCPDTGACMFMEINSTPMMAGFDAHSKGAMGRALMDWLAGDLDIRTLARKAERAA